MTQTIRSAGQLYPDAPWYFTLLLVVAVIGFYPSYFSVLGETDAAHHFHGALATTWMLMLILQSWLMRKRLFHAHRVTGRASLVIAPLFVVSGIMIIYVMVSSSNGFSQAFGARFAFVDILTVGYFALAYALAIHHRRNTALHARYLASTAILVLPPALARTLQIIPGLDSVEPSFHVSFLISELVVVTLLLRDLRQSAPLIPYAVLLSLLVIEQIGFIVVPSIGWWNALCASFVS
jgi:hypothetical protein